MNRAGVYLHGLTQAEFVWLVMTVDPFVASRRKGVSYYEVELPEGIERISYNMSTLGLSPVALSLMFNPPKQ